MRKPSQAYLNWAKRMNSLPALYEKHRREADEKTVAERQWQKGKLAPAPQKQCDHGLFSDDANQKELF